MGNKHSIKAPPHDVVEAEALFKKLDKNHDGRLDLVEFTVLANEIAKHRFSFFSFLMKKMVVADRTPEFAEWLFNDVDIDGSGNISWEEFRQFCHFMLKGFPPYLTFSFSLGTLQQRISKTKFRMVKDFEDKDTLSVGHVLDIAASLLDPGQKEEVEKRGGLILYYGHDAKVFHNPGESFSLNDRDCNYMLLGLPLLPKIPEQLVDVDLSNSIGVVSITDKLETVTIDGSGTESVEEMKRKYQDRTGTPIEQQVWIFNAVVLENNNLVSDAKLVPGSLVYCVLNLTRH